jgi:hypothetical protein
MPSVGRNTGQRQTRAHVDFMNEAEQALRGVREAMTAPPAAEAPVETPPTLDPQK